MLLFILGIVMKRDRDDDEEDYSLGLSTLPSAPHTHDSFEWVAKEVRQRKPYYLNF